MLWYNNGLDAVSLLGSTSLTTPLLNLGTIPTSYLAGMTILRMLILTRYVSTTVTSAVDALMAIYVATRGTASLPIDLNVANANYYYFTALQAMSNPGGTIAPPYTDKADIRSKRIIANSERDLFLRITNNSSTSIQVAVQLRLLLALK